MEPLIQKLGITKEEAEILESMPKRDIGRLYQEQNKLHSDTYSEYYDRYHDEHWDHNDTRI